MLARFGNIIYGLGSFILFMYVFVCIYICTCARAYVHYICINTCTLCKYFISCVSWIFENVIDSIPRNNQTCRIWIMHSLPGIQINGAVVEMVNVTIHRLHPGGITLRGGKLRLDSSARKICSNVQGGISAEHRSQVWARVLFQTVKWHNTREG